MLPVKFSDFLQRKIRRGLLIEINPYQILVAGISRLDASPAVLDCAAEFDREDEAGLRQWLGENFDQKKIILNKIKLNNFNIYFKEHPSFEGSFNLLELNTSKKINFLKSHLSISNLLNKIDLLITFNSKAGLESLLKKKPVICLSDSIYSGSGLAFKANKKIIDDNIINQIIKRGVSSKKVEKLFISIFKKTFFFNLFTQNSKDLSLSSLSFRDVLKKIL